MHHSLAASFPPLLHAQTMDCDKFKAFSNGEGPVDAATMCAVGPYNMLLGDMRHYKVGRLDVMRV